jgi:signal transduction histidine kinase
MKSFILEHLEEILVEWEAFAGTQTPAADAMDSVALRDHAKQMLLAIAKDIETSQTKDQQEQKSKGRGPASAHETAAEAHGALRQQVGFDLGQLIAEFRALRASVLKIWVAKERYGDAQSAYEMARFNEAIDQALCESVATFSAELSRSRETFLGVLGHDLRTPLGAVWTAVEILAKSDSMQKRERAYDAATRSLGSMRAMISDLLDFTRSRLGKGIPVMPAAEDLERICRASVAEVALAYPKASIQFAGAGRLEGEFDRERMLQVFSNLLGNAVQHGDPLTGVAMFAKEDGDFLRVEVNNRGKPIPPQHLQSIFEPLVQLEGATGATERKSSMGLGLYIAREIVNAHGGSLEATSSEQAGTTFTVALPRTARPRAAFARA